MSNGFAHVAVITAFALSAVGCSKAPTAASGPSIVDVAAPLERVIVDRDTFPGRFDAVESVEVRPRVSGYVDSVNFKDGDDRQERRSALRYRSEALRGGGGRGQGATGGCQVAADSRRPGA